ncbi:MAG TPA: hypothetical protein VNW52_09605 [Burkholderiaceae bacterium]|jgi:hypothetical protein|nr:hypothetical protein [Burkholderiaceae bacterium]
MLNKHHQPRSRQASSLPTQRARIVAPWRIWTALLTMITFVVLLSTAATHHHATVVDDQDCAICSVVTHKIADLSLTTLPALVLILLSYAPFLLAKPGTVHASLRLLPPSCGPPASI